MNEKTKKCIKKLEKAVSNLRIRVDQLEEKTDLLSKKLHRMRTNGYQEQIAKLNVKVRILLWVAGLQVTTLIGLAYRIFSGP